MEETHWYIGPRWALDNGKIVPKKTFVTEFDRLIDKIKTKQT